MNVLIIHYLFVRTCKHTNNRLGAANYITEAHNLNINYVYVCHVNVSADLMQTLGLIVMFILHCSRSQTSISFVNMRQPSQNKPIAQSVQYSDRWCTTVIVSRI